MADNPKYKREQDRIVGKVIIRAILVNDTPLLIGKGEGDAADIEIMRYPDGRPYIPASSMAGALKSHLNGAMGYFWGKSGKKEKSPLQSHFCLQDLVPAGSVPEDVSMRDGVKIDHSTGTAEDEKKYDYQLVEPEVEFPFTAEITLRASMPDDWQTFVSQIKGALADSGFRVGANTNTGFGKLTCRGFEAFHFDFPKDADAWFGYLEHDKITIDPISIEKIIPERSKQAFQIKATFSLSSSLMIGAYGVEGDEPDKSQLKSRNRYVLPGKSIRGAIRHRAVRIWNAWGRPLEELEDLFGIVKEEEKIQKRSRLRVEEFRFQDSEVTPMVQNRIRIDRFTGGVIDGALFNSEPVWSTRKEKIQLTFTIWKEPKETEKALLLHLMKDLWLEDLAIGGEKNIGRGILKGQSAKVFSEGQLLAEFERSNENNGLTFIQGSAADLPSAIIPQSTTT